MAKLFKNENGSTLLMIIIVMFALTVLGVAMISMTILGTNMKYNDTRSKKSMYYAESGLEQVYAIVAEQVHKATGYATTNTNTAMADLDSTLMLQLTDNFGVYTELTDSGDVYYSVSYDPLVLTADEDQFEERANEEFEDYFKEYFNSSSSCSFNDGSFITSLSNGTIESVDDTHTLSFVDPATNIDFIDFDNTSDDTYKIENIQSKIVYNNNLTDKIIIADISISAPDISYPVSLVENNAEVIDNPIWQNALVAVGDIDVYSGSSLGVDDVTIYGDVYAYGLELPSSVSDKKDNDKYGGLRLQSGILNIEGDIITTEHVKTIGSYSILNIDDSHVYCGSLIIDDTAIGSKVIVDNSNLYTYDDIEINADDSELNIDGSYFGFSDGSTVDTSHDFSSSIVINADTTTSTELLTITGNAASIDYNEVDDSDQVITGAYIYGSSYIKEEAVTERSYIYWPYQTAESIAIKGNYLVYTEDYSDTTHDEAKNSGLKFVVSHDITDPNETLSFSDKIDFFMNHMDDTDSYYDVGSTKIDIADDVIKYSSGVYVDNDSSSTGFYENTGSFVGINDIINPIIDDYLFYLNTSENRVDNDADMPDEDYIYIDPFNPSSDKITDETINIIENCITDPSGVINSYDDEGDWIKDTSQFAAEVSYVNLDSSVTDVTIVGNGGTTGLGVNNNVDIEAVNGLMQGIIITDGDVYISGELDYCGVIIAEGDIIIENDGLKTISNEEKSPDGNINLVTQHLIEMISENADLQDMFDDYYDTIYDNGSEEYISAQTGVTLVTSSDTNLSDLYSDFVKIENWHQD